jgi:DNA polymerase-3 subunit gamma/tau
MRDAQSLLDQVITFCDGKLSREAVTEALGLTNRHLLNEILQALVGSNLRDMIGLIERLLAAGHEPKIFLNDLLEQIRHLLIVKLHPQASGQLVDLPETEISLLKDFATKIGDEDIHLMFDLALKAAQDVGRHHDARLVLEVVLLRMASAPRVSQLIAIASKTSLAPTTAVESRPPRPSSNDGAAGPKLRSATTVDVGSRLENPPATPTDRWSDFVNKVKKVNAIVGAQLENTYLKTLSANAVVLGIPAKLKFLQVKLGDKEFQKKISNYLLTFWGQDLSINIEVDEDAPVAESLTPKATEEKIKRDRDESLRQAVENHPLVKNTQNVFKTQIKAINPSNQK